MHAPLWQESNRAANSVPVHPAQNGSSPRLRLGSRQNCESPFACAASEPGNLNLKPLRMQASVSSASGVGRSWRCLQECDPVLLSKEGQPPSSTFSNVLHTSPKTTPLLQHIATIQAMQCMGHANCQRHQHTRPSNTYPRRWALRQCCTTHHPPQSLSLRRRPKLSNQKMEVGMGEATTRENMTSEPAS